MTSPCFSSRLNALFLRSSYHFLSYQPQIKFDHPVTLLPHTQRGLYCHSSLPDDLGIQYQSYRSKESIVACNEVRLTHFPLHNFIVSVQLHSSIFCVVTILTGLPLLHTTPHLVLQHITLLAGLGHTGSVPFDEQQGWYRAWRGLSGTVSYK